MAHYFNYDKVEHKHRIYSIEVKNEKNEIVGYRPLVERFDAKKSGTVEQISDKYPQLKWKVFSTPELARDFAITFFQSL